MSTLREHIERRIAESGVPMTAESVRRRLLATALATQPPRIERGDIWKERKGRKARRPDAAKIEAAMERLWESEPDWVKKALEACLTTSAVMSLQTT